VKIGAAGLQADISVPAPASGVIIFAHGSGSGRLSPRNRQVAEQLNGAGFATILFDLLTERAESTVFNTLWPNHVEAVASARNQKSLSHLPIGLFGASTGAAAALMAAAERGNDIGAVVSRGGRPDLAFEVLDHVTAPTLLIVGGYDEKVIEMNKTALAALRCEKRLEIIPGATHLFEEPGTLDRVVDLTIDWFSLHLGAGEE
jgi:pimeloyl-ACP methyl ester carboxylesterase